MKELAEATNRTRRSIKSHQLAVNPGNPCRIRRWCSAPQRDVTPGDFDPLFDVSENPVELVKGIIGDFQATFARFSMIDADLGSELF